MTPSDFHPPLSSAAWGVLPTRPCGPYVAARIRHESIAQPWMRWYKPSAPLTDWTAYRTVALGLLCVLSPVVLHAALMILSSYGVLP
jgi:hypothetical protein